MSDNKNPLVGKTLPTVDDRATTPPKCGGKRAYYCRERARRYSQSKKGRVVA